MDAHQCRFWDERVSNNLLFCRRILIHSAGGICCSITHGALTPVDVVKTRVQLDPVKVGQ